MKVSLGFLQDKCFQDIVFRIITLFLALMGLSTWRKQLKGSTRFQIARDILESIYKVEAAFEHVRNPFMSVLEFPEHLLKSMLTDKNSDIEATTYAYNNRLNVLNKEMELLEDRYIKGIAVYGDSFRSAIIPFRKCRAQLVVGIQALIDSKRRPFMGKEVVDYGKIIYSLGKNTRLDQLSDKIEESKLIMISAIKPYLSDSIFDKFKRIGLKKRIINFDPQIPYKESLDPININTELIKE